MCIRDRSKSIEIKISESIINLFNKEKTMVKNKEEIIKLIKSTGKKIIVMIDDADRLTGTEMLNLFKLLRNIGDFPNVISVSYTHLDVYKRQD